MEKIGLFGGTFNPIHIGHLILAQTVLEKIRLDRIMFIPCRIPALKQVSFLAPDQDRLNMLKLATEYESRFFVSDIELKREGISYTIDTIKELFSEDKEFFLILGEDNIKDFKNWKEPEEIVRLVKLIIVNRGGYENNIPASIYEKEVIKCKIPNIEISSTTIRDRIANNLTIKNFVPDSVYKYILDNKLYRR